MKVVFVSGNFQKDTIEAECFVDDIHGEFYSGGDGTEFIDKRTHLTINLTDEECRYISEELRRQAHEISKRIPMYKFVAEDEQMETLLESKLGDFKKQLADINEQALSKLYCDVLPYILSDTQYNMVNIIDDCLTKIIKGDFKVEIDQWNNYTITVEDQNGFTHRLSESMDTIWGTLVKKIYEANPDALKDTHIKQLESQIESLQYNLTRAYQR